jgi:ferredoxin-type protein NapF
MGIARRAFLRGDFAAPRTALRPPWALPEAAFLEHCTRCDACVDACATGILIRAGGGYPEIDFKRGECTFCGECVKACVERALKPGALAWTLRPLVGSDCLAHKHVVCRSCADACGTRAIRFAPGGAALPHLLRCDCTGCGACVGACPVSAIAMREPLSCTAS